jgi:hypothetical protein
MFTAPLPNTRVQRTRSSPSALGSPLTRHPLGRPQSLAAKVGGGILIVLIAGLGALVGCRGRVREFVLAADTRPGWVAVVMGDPRCSPLTEASTRRFEIPSSGYLCTSTPLNSRWGVDRYLLTRAAGGEKRLTIGQEVSQEQVVQLQWKQCEIKAIAFWYGAAGKVEGSPATAIEQNVKGCP